MITGPDTTTQTPDGNGNRLTVTDANQHTTSYVYNNMDRPTTRTDPLGNQSKAQYDLSGNLIQSTDRKGQITTIQYDGLNRATNVAFNDGSAITYALDGGNRLVGVTDSISGTISRSYDGLDHILLETTPQGSVGYTYDADERRQSMTVSGQAPVNYTFDNASRVTSIVQGASGVSFAYDGDGRRTSLTLPNGVIANYTYDAGSQLTGIVYAGGALGAQNLEYTYDLAGRRASVSGSLASTQLPVAVSSAVYNANNQLTQWGGTAMTYDANGNTLSDGTNTYVWDARNGLVSADNNGATFSYDPLGRRVAKTVMSTSTSFLYDGLNPVQEQSGGSITANLLTGGIDERFTRTDSTGSYYYLTDALGSTVALTDPTGASQVEYSYAPYGSMSVTGTTTNSYGYTGRETDGLGINYYRARYYNPATGRFLSEDPIGFAGGINKYAYAGDDPIDFADPSGLTTQSNWDFLWNWLSGGGSGFYAPPDIRYYINDMEDMEMANSPGVNNLRQYFYNKNCQNVKDFDYGTGHAAWDTVLNPSTADWSSTAAQVGAWGPASATNNGNGTVTFTVLNIAGANSFLLHLLPNSPFYGGPMHNVYQEFQWTETIPTSGHKCGCH